MSTEIWITLSVVFSLVLAVAGWGVQLVLSRDSARRERRLRELEDALSDERHENARDREQLRRVELARLVRALADRHDRADRAAGPAGMTGMTGVTGMTGGTGSTAPARTDAGADVLIQQIDEQLATLPSSDEMGRRIDRHERALSDILTDIHRWVRDRGIIQGMD